MIVADASAVVELLLGGAKGRLVEAIFLAAEDRIQAPDVLDVEVAQALRRLVRHGSVTVGRAAASVAILREAPFTRHASRPLLPRVWELRENLTAYDAAYVALAEALECELVTFDERIGGAPGHRARVRVPA